MRGIMTSKMIPFNFILYICCIYALMISEKSCDALLPPTVQDQQLMFTSDYCFLAGTGFSQSLAVQTREDHNIYLMTCAASVLVWRYQNQSLSTLLTFPDTFVYSFPQIVQHPITGDAFFPYNGYIWSFSWMNVSNQSTFAPPLTQHPYNRTICPYVCSSVGLVFSFDGSHVYAGCSTDPCDEASPLYVVAIHLMTQQTIYINMTANETSNSQNIMRLSPIEDTNQLLIISLMYGITVYDMSQTMEIMQASASLSSSPLNDLSELSTPPIHVLLDSSACYIPIVALIDRTANLLIAFCDNQTIVWNLISMTNISVDPLSGVVIYPQSPSQECGTPSLVYHRPKRTLYQSCSSGSDRVVALQNLDTPHSVVLTSLVDVATCSSSQYIMTDRTQPDVLYSMCTEGLMRMEGRDLTPISIDSECIPSSVVYDWRTDSTYVMCDSTSYWPLVRLNNHEMEGLSIPFDCLYPLQLLYDTSLPHSPQLFLACGNDTSAFDGETELWNISLEMGSAYRSPQLLFTLPFNNDLCAYNHAHLMFYCMMDYNKLFTWNASEPEVTPQIPTFILPSPDLITGIGVCSGWLLISTESAKLYGLPLVQLGINSEPRLLFGNLTMPSNGKIYQSNLICDSKRNMMSVAISTQINLQLVQIIFDETMNPLVSVHALESDGDVTVSLIDVDTELNRVYITLSPNRQTSALAYLIIWEGEIQRFLSTIQIAKATSPYVNGLFVDSHTSQVFMAIGSAHDIMYSHIAILTSGWRCTTGTSWYQGSCQPCPIAESRSIVISTLNSTYLIPQCVSCASGSIANVTGTIECIQCSQGRFADVAVGQVCSPCVGGYYANQTGSSTCSPCERGRFSNISEASSCYTADLGSYVSVLGQSMQFQCPSGRYSNVSGLTLCYECTKGTYASQYGALNCTAADEGFYVDQSGQHLQRPCFPGSFTNTTGSTFCSPCSSGRFASGTNSTICLPCALGRFSALAASDCPTCSADAYTPRLGASCLSCTDQEGLLCINGLASVAVGWWPYLINDTSDSSLQVYRTTKCPPGYCQGATLQFVSPTPNDSLFSTPQLCVSPRLNSPENWLCADCEDGFLSWSSSCQLCPGPDVGLICGALILSFVLVYVLLRMDPSASPLTILAFFQQIAALELVNVTHWIDWIQLSNPSARSFTHCLIPLTPIQQMILTLCVPFILTLILAILAGSHSLISVYVTPSSWYQSALNSPAPSRFIRLMSACSFSYNRDQYIGTINAILIFCYTSVTVTVVSALHCVEVAPGISRLFNSPTIDCHSTEYRSVLLPFVYVWLSCYVIGLPICMLIFVWRKIQMVITAAYETSLINTPAESIHHINDDSLVSVESGVLHGDVNSSAISNDDDVSISTLSFSPDTVTRPPLEDRPIPHQLRRSASTASISFHHRWGHFYRPYRVGAWYWQPIEMIQRFAFALVSVLLIEHSAARYAMYSTLTIVSLLLHQWSQPFTTDRQNQMKSIAYFLLVFISFLLSGQQPPYTISVQILFFLLIVPFSVTLLVYGAMKSLIELRTSKPHPPPLSRHHSMLSLQHFPSFPPRRLSRDFAEPLLPSF